MSCSRTNKRKKGQQTNRSRTQCLCLPVCPGGGIKMHRMSTAIGEFCARSFLEPPAVKQNNWRRRRIWLLSANSVWNIVLSEHLSTTTLYMTDCLHVCVSRWKKISCSCYVEKPLRPGPAVMAVSAHEILLNAYSLRQGFSVHAHDMVNQSPRIFHQLLTIPKVFWLKRHRSLSGTVLNKILHRDTPLFDAQYLRKGTW